MITENKVSLYLGDVTMILVDAVEVDVTVGTIKLGKLKLI